MIGFTEVDGGIRADRAAKLLVAARFQGFDPDAEDPTELRIGLMLNGELLAFESNSGPAATSVATRKVDVVAGDVLGVRLAANQPGTFREVRLIAGERTQQDGNQRSYATVFAFERQGTYVLVEKTGDVGLGTIMDAFGSDVDGNLLARDGGGRLVWRRTGALRIAGFAQAELGLEVNDPRLAAVLSIGLPLATDPENRNAGRIDETRNLPPTEFAAGAIAQFADATVQSIDTTYDEYNLSASIQIFNADRSQTMTLVGNKSADAMGPGDIVEMIASDLTVTDSTGDDLAYDPDTGTISTTGGGTYSIVANLHGNWD